MYKMYIPGKRRRSKARVALKKKIQPGSVAQKSVPGVCVSSGKGLLFEMSETS